MDIDRPGATFTIDTLRELHTANGPDHELFFITGADALVLMTPWADYRELDFAAVRARMANPYVLDTAGLWNGEKLAGLGFAYDEIGRGRHPRTDKGN